MQSCNNINYLFRFYAKLCQSDGGGGDVMWFEINIGCQNSTSCPMYTVLYVYMIKRSRYILWYSDEIFVYSGGPSVWYKMRNMCWRKIRQRLIVYVGGFPCQSSAVRQAQYTYVPYQ